MRSAGPISASPAMVRRMSALSSTSSMAGCRAALSTAMCWMANLSNGALSGCAPLMAGKDRGRKEELPMGLLARWSSTLALTALALSVVTGAHAESAAERAVKEAQKYRGQTITIVWEAGLQALDPLNFSGPKWEKLTGVDVKVVEVATAEMFTKIMQDYKSGAAAYDALNVIPSWMPDLVNAGALEDLDPYVDKYGYRDELQSIAPVYRDNQMTVDGK